MTSTVITGATFDIGGGQRLRDERSLPADP
jgi:hypothetical protein